jgi:hypothetical protein
MVYTYNTLTINIYKVNTGRSWTFSWAISHICANDEYRSQYLSLVYLYVFEFESNRRFQFSFTNFSLVCRSAFAQIFPRSQPIRESTPLPITRIF